MNLYLKRITATGDVTDAARPRKQTNPQTTFKGNGSTGYTQLTSAANFQNRATIAATHAAASRHRQQIAPRSFNRLAQTEIAKKASASTLRTSSTGSAKK